MVDKYLTEEDTNMSDDLRIRRAQLIYTMVVKEMIRQNKTICLERGKLMEKIWNSNIKLFAVAEEL